MIDNKRCTANPMADYGNSATPFQDAVNLLNTHDGMRFEAVKDLIMKMHPIDVRQITDFCLRQERSLFPRHKELKDHVK